MIYYDKAESRVEIADGITYSISGIIFNNFFKVFSIGDNSCLILLDVCFKHKFPDFDVNKMKWSDFVILVNGNDFNKMLPKAHEIGRRMAIMQINDLLKNSTLFQQAYADKHLSPIVTEINSKKSKSNKSSNFRYPLWELKKDLKSL